LERGPAERKGRIWQKARSQLRLIANGLLFGEWVTGIGIDMTDANEELRTHAIV